MKSNDDLNIPARIAAIRIQLLTLLLLGVVAYANSFTVPLHYDDVMTLRKYVGTPQGIGGGVSSRWITDLSFALNRLAHGEIVTGYHIVNLAIHLAATVCLYLLVRFALTALRSSFGLYAEDEPYSFLLRFVPFATAALFVCHPIQTQAVTYIAQRYTSLATAFYLASLLAFVRARLQPPGPRAWIWGGIAFTAALLAMMSKEIAFTLPLMALLLEIALFRGRLLKNPYFLSLCALLLLCIPLQIMSRSGLQGIGDLPALLGQASTEVREISRGDYFLTQLRVVVTYLRLLLLPINQNLDYDYPLQHSLLAPQVLASLALHLALAGTGLALYFRSRRTLPGGGAAAGAAMRMTAVGIGWFYLALAVESSVIPIRDVINEHRLYLPSAGFFLAVTSVAALAANRVSCRRGAWCLAAVCCLLLTVATVARNRVWGSQLGLWQDVLAKSPNKSRAQYQVGFNLAQNMMPDKALPHLVRAIEQLPQAPDYWITLNALIPNLRAFEGRYDTGLHYHLMAFSIDPRYLKPWRAASYNNLGLAYEYLGNYREARVNFAKAVSTNPALDLGWFNLAVTAARLGDQAGFTAACDRLRAVNPDLARSAAGMVLPSR